MTVETKLKTELKLSEFFKKWGEIFRRGGVGNKTVDKNI